MDWQAARVSLLLAVLTAVLLLPPGIALARWLAFTSWRGKPLAEALLMLPLLLPPTVIGFYLLLALGQGSPVGGWLARQLDLRLVFSFEGLLLASLLINLPFMVQPIQRAFAAIPHSLREAAWVCGPGPLAHLREDRIAAGVARPARRAWRSRPRTPWASSAWC